MAAAATSGGLLITFTFLLLILVLGCTAVVRFKNPDFWQNSQAADLYRRVFRTVILIIIGATVAVTIAIPRWTRSSPPFSDSFVGMGMFETCACSDPATFCQEGAGFRAVQGFSVLQLLSLAGLCVISAVGASMQLDEELQTNAANPPAIGSTSPSAPPPAPSPQPKAAANAAATVDDDNDEGPAGGGPSIASNLPSLLSLILLFFALFCSFFAFIIYSARGLNKACDGTTLYGHTFGSGDPGWGFVFRIFEWLFISAVAITYLLCVKKVCSAFDFPMSRVHVFSLLIFCMSCLSTTTATWSTTSVNYSWNNGAGTSAQTVGAFFACRCSSSLCAATQSAQDAGIAFYMLFFFFFVPRAFYVICNTAVWKHALKPLYNCCDSVGISEKIKNLTDKIPTNVANIISGVFALLIPIFLLIAVIITASVVASEECGMTQQTADFGLVFCVIALFLCAFEGFIAFLDAIKPVDGAPGASETEDGAAGAGHNNEELANTTTAMNKRISPNASLSAPPQQQQDGGEADANFSGVVMAPPVDHTRSNSPGRNNKQFHNGPQHQFNNPYVTNNHMNENSLVDTNDDSPAVMSPADGEAYRRSNDAPFRSGNSRQQQPKRQQQQDRSQSGNHSLNGTPHNNNGVPPPPPPPPPKVKQAVAVVAQE